MNKLVKVLPFAVALLAVSGPAFAQDAIDPNLWKGQVGLAAGIAMAFGVLGAALGQGMAAGKALEGIARNPQAAGKIQTPMLISLAFIESLAIYALVIAFFLQGKI
jgi:F-type H+-transporting ATPase subunit c